MVKASHHNFEVHINYLDSIIDYSGYPKDKIKDMFYKIAVVAINNGSNNTVEYISEIFSDLQNLTLKLPIKA
jgi:hypothetical protein